MSRLTRKYRGRISTVNCNGVFASDEAGAALMPDSLHPNADGHHFVGAVRNEMRGEGGRFVCSGCGAVMRGTGTFSRYSSACITCR